MKDLAILGRLTPPPGGVPARVEGIFPGALVMICSGLAERAYASRVVKLSRRRRGVLISTSTVTDQRRFRV